MNYPHFKMKRLRSWEAGVLRSGVIKWGLVGERRGLRQGPWTSWSAFQPNGPAHQPPLSCTAAAPATGGHFRVHCSHTARVRTWRLLTVHPAVTSCIRRVICGFLYSSHSFLYKEDYGIHFLIIYFWVHIFKPYMVETYGMFFFF